MLTQPPDSHNTTRLYQLLIAQQCRVWAQHHYEPFINAVNFGSTIAGYIRDDTEYLNRQFPDCEPPASTTHNN